MLEDNQDQYGNFIILRDNGGDSKLKSKKKIRTELQRVKRAYEEMLVSGHLFPANQLKQRGLALCWVLDKYWGDVVLE